MIRTSKNGFTNVIIIDYQAEVMLLETHYGLCCQNIFYVSLVTFD